MKKILLAVLLVFALTANAQRNYEIESQLKLKTVNAGVKSDSVLVRGADKVVKFVPQSSIGESGSKDLQSVLNTGKTASFDDGVNVLELLNGDAYNRFVTMRVADTIGKTTEVSLVPNQLSLSNTLFGKTTSLSITDGVFALSNNNNNGQTNVIIDEPNTGVYADIRFPAKPLTGSYILATKDDISALNINNILASGDTAVDKEINLNRSGTNPYKTRLGAGIVNVYNISSGTFSGLDGESGLVINTNGGIGYGNLRSDNCTASISNQLPNAWGTLAISVNDNPTDVNGNVQLSSITTTFTTNDGKTVTVTNGVITNIE